MNRELKYALGKTVPIMFSYLFLSMAFGIMMNQAGFPFYWAYLVSLTVYTGAFQFVMDRSFPRQQGLLLLRSRLWL